MSINAVQWKWLFPKEKESGDTIFGDISFAENQAKSIFNL